MHRKTGESLSSPTKVVCFRAWRLSFVLCTYGSVFIYLFISNFCTQAFTLGFGIKYCKFMEAKLSCLLITKQKLPGVLRPVPYSFNKLINFLSSNLGVPRNDDATPCGKYYL